MGNTDSRTCDYLKDNARFADVINYIIYGGNQVVKPDDLHEVDTSEVVFPYAGKIKSEVIQRYRDIIKNVRAGYDDKAVYMIVGIENQTEIHYAMPVRNMLYDAEHYAKQVQVMAKRHRKSKGEKATNGEFLSGFFKRDKLVPVITIVVLWSPDEWDGPVTLHDMLLTNDSDVLKFVPDYRINLISPFNMSEEDFGKLKTNMAEVLRFIKYSKDKVALMNALESNDLYKHMDRETAELIRDVTGADVEFDEGEEVINMCKALEDMKADAKKEGRKEGRKEGALQSTLSALRNLMETTGFTIEQAMNALKVPEKDRAMYMNKI